MTREEAFRQARMRGVPLAYYLDVPPQNRFYGVAKAKSLVGGLALSLLLALGLLALFL